jgi:5-methyltetrahydrofolate--homocysteine methyltransferase
MKVRLTEQNEILTKLQESIVNLDIKSVHSACQEALAANIPPVEAIEKGLSKGMRIVGQKFESGEFFLSELMMAGEVMKEGMKILEPHIKGGGYRKLAKIVVGTVEGDLHDIGKNLFVSLAKAAGFEVVDLGVDVSTDQFKKCVAKEEPEILGMSTLLTLTLPTVEGVVRALEKAKLRNRVKVIVGGAPVTPQFGKKAKVDCAAESAVEGVNRCLDWAKELT